MSTAGVGYSLKQLSSWFLGFLLALVFFLSRKTGKYIVYIVRLCWSAENPNYGNLDPIAGCSLQHFKIHYRSANTAYATSSVLFLRITTFTIPFVFFYSAMCFLEILTGFSSALVRFNGQLLQLRSSGNILVGKH